MNIYPDLVRVFFTNLKIIDITSHVKGVDMEITLEVWTAYTGLKHDGLMINKGNIGVVEESNKMQFYRRCLKNPQYKVRNFSVGGLRLNDRLMAFIVTWMLIARGSNHFVLIGEDPVFIYCIMNKVKINWIHIIKEHMLKSMRLSDYHYPYAILIFKFLHYFEVDLEEEQSEVVKTSLEVNNGSLSKMGFTKIGGKWGSKDGDQAGSSSGAHAEDGGEEQADIVVAVGFQVGDDDAGPSAGIMGERITSMSPFERLMLRRMENFADEQRSHHEFCVARFHNLYE